MSQCRMESPPELPQLSSYLPQSIGVISAATTDNSDNSRMTDVPTPARQRKRKQASGAYEDYKSEERVETPASHSRLEEIYIPHIRSTSVSSGGGTPVMDTTVYTVNELFQPTTPRRERTSRYLSEGDRREIIARIDSGEKQVTLAREFGVSRAAICNLYKKRWEVLTRVNRDPSAKHPKKSHSKKGSPRLTSQATPKSRSNSNASKSPIPDVSAITINGDQIEPAIPTQSEPQHKASIDGVASPSQVVEDRSSPRSTNHEATQESMAPRRRFDEIVGSSAASAKPFLVHEASAYSYPCRNLVASLRDINTSTTLFQQRSTRLIRLLIEEVITCLPHEDVEIKNEYGDVCHATKTLDERDICAISMEDKGMVLLHAFSDISPASSSGVISIEATSEQDASKPPRVLAQLPCIRPHQAVILLDIQCATGEEACAVLHHLVHDRHVAEENIYFATVISSFEGLQNVFRRFPGRLKHW